MDFLATWDARKVNAGDVLRSAREAHRSAAIAKATPGGWYFFEGGWRKVGDQ